jgi:hypothetical protein
MLSRHVVDMVCRDPAWDVVKAQVVMERYFLFHE